MTQPIRSGPDSRDDGDASAAASPLGTFINLAVGLSTLPLLGLMAAWSRVGVARGESEPDRPPAEERPRAPSDLPDRGEVEAALAALTKATLPKGPPRGGSHG